MLSWKPITQLWVFSFLTGGNVSSLAWNIHTGSVFWIIWNLIAIVLSTFYAVAAYKVLDKTPEDLRREEILRRWQK